MNERLTALCEQAISEVWESRKGPDGLVRTDGNPYIFYEKFAQLIIKECCLVLEQTQTALDRHKWPTPSECGVYIKEHFGVEE